MGAGRVPHRGLSSERNRPLNTEGSIYPPVLALSVVCDRSTLDLTRPPVIRSLMLPTSTTLIPTFHSMNTSDTHVDHGGIEEVRRLGPQNCPPKVGADLATVEAQKLILALGMTTELAQAVVPVLIRNLITLEAKQKDYGPHNLTKFGSFGVVVRMGDKMERIINLANREQKVQRSAEALRGFVPQVQNEPLADSFLDMANYSLIGYVMNTGVWPK